VLALFERFPSLVGRVPHVDLGVRRTPIDRVEVDGHALLIKRDDLSAPSFGGNKVRALEFLLAGVSADDTVLTVGSTGSTHALATATYARELGANCDVITWPQEENSVSRLVASRLSAIARVTHAHSPVDAYVRALLRRIRNRAHWVPAGASSPHGALGSVSAALELASQLQASGDRAAEIIVPLGSGGTVAGMLVGLSIAEAQTCIRAVRVVPRIIGNRGHVLRLAWQTHALIRRLAGERIPPLDRQLLTIDHRAFGGAYGRETNEGASAASALNAAGGPQVDTTYSAKALAVALERNRSDGDVLFWLTFDSRPIADG
jgi:D-cysteine desulfhydrase